MNKKTIIAIAALSISGFTYAGGYSSSQMPDNSGYSSSQTPPANGGYVTTQTSGRTNTVFEKHNKHFSFSVSLPGAERPTGQTYYIAEKMHREHSHAPKWVSSSYGNIPKHAVAGGYEANGNPLYICQAKYHGGMHPGKIVGDNCNFSYGGSEIMTPSYQVLTMHSGYNWVSGNGNYIPANAISGGYENGHPLYVCQTQYQGGMHPGKLVGRNCNFSYAGNEISSSSFNLLIG